MKEYKNMNDILDDFEINYDAKKFIDLKLISDIVLDTNFIDDLDYSVSQISNQDKEYFVRDFVVSPLLFRAWRLHPKLALFSHPYLKSDDIQCYPDFLFTARHPRGTKELYRPLLITVETEHEEFTEDWQQALLQMIAAQQINKDKTIPIHAIVSNGKYWEFGKLENNIFTKNITPTSLENPEKLVGILSYLVGEAEKYA